MNKAILIICTLLSACSANYYSPVDQDETAILEVWSLSEELPHVTMNISGHNYGIANENIGIRGTTVAATEVQIPAGESIHVEASFHWLTEGPSLPRPMANGHYRYDDSQSLKEEKSCSDSADILAAQNRKYYLVFGVHGDECHIEVREEQGL